MTTDTIDQLRTELLDAVAKADNAAALDEVRVTALGKKGRITGLPQRSDLVQIQMNEQLIVELYSK